MSGLLVALLIISLGSRAEEKELARPAESKNKVGVEEEKLNKDTAEGDAAEALKEEIKKEKYYKEKDKAKAELPAKKISGKPQPSKPPGAKPPPLDEAPPPPGEEPVEDEAPPSAGDTWTPRGRGYDKETVDAPPPPTDEVESVSKQVSTEGKRAVGRALRSADALKRGLLRDEGVAPGRTGEIPGLDANAPLKPRGSSDPSEPATPHDLMLASMSGFGGAFTSLGLKAGAAPGGEPAIFRSDGTPATAQEVSALRARIASEPKALMRQPDFFEVLPRERFEDLKREYRTQPGLRDASFRDITLTERDRDFLWSASCSKLSGDCNPHASAPSYKQGEEVPARDLGSIWEEVAGSEPENEEGVGEYSDEDLERIALAEAAQERLSKSVFGGARVARLLEGASAAFAGLGNLFGLGAEEQVGSSEVGYGATPAGGAEGGKRSLGGGRTAARPRARLDLLEPASPSPQRKPRGRGAWVALAAAAAALALMLAWVRRRR